MHVDVLVWVVLLLAAAIRYRQLPSSSRSRPEAIEEESPIKDLDKRHEKWFDLVKLEYEKATERYDNIYRAVWQNFSYMAALAAGILTFGAGKIEDPFLFIALALTPLVFWLIAIFLPMDHYGDATRSRLSVIERDINRIYLPEADAPKLGHFILFRDTKYKWRVRNVVNAVGSVIAAAWLLCGIIAAHHWIATAIRS